MYRKRSTIMAAVISILSSFATAALGALDYEITASGSYFSGFVDSSTYDGTTVRNGTLPPLLDLPGIEGGSFRATYRFTQVTPETGTTSAYYELSASSGMTSYELLDSNGVVVHHGSGPTFAEAYLANNYGSSPYSVDQVLLGSTGLSVTGINVPASLYSSPPSFFSLAGFNFSEYAGNGGPEYLDDLSIPTEAATYLAFPNFKVMDVILEFGDGDFIDRLDPYQYAYIQLQYDITALTVTPIPEPTAACILLPALSALARRRRTAWGAH